MAFRSGPRSCRSGHPKIGPHMLARTTRSAHENGFLLSPVVIGPNEPALSPARDRVPGPAGATHVRHTAEGKC
jgi:hypothetical protein